MFTSFVNALLMNDVIAMLFRTWGRGVPLRRRAGKNDPMPAFGEEDSRGIRVERQWCCGCLEWHPFGAFRPSETFDRKGGTGGYCREYRSAAVRRWRERNPEAVEEYNAERRIGPRERECVGCGVSFTAGLRGPASNRCPDCRHQRKLEQRRTASAA